jgi:hypothetical protein
MLVLDDKGGKACSLAIFACIRGFEGIGSRDVEFLLLNLHRNLPTFLELAYLSEFILSISAYIFHFGLLDVLDKSFLQIWPGDLFWEVHGNLEDFE